MNRNRIYSVFIAILLCACHKEQAELAKFNKNCSCAKKASANFEVREMTILSQPQYSTTPTDTIWPDASVTFTANEDSVKHTWYVGGEMLHEKSFYRTFTSDLSGQTIPITLVIKKKPNRICFPDDDGVDSVVKIITVSDFNINNGTLFEQGHHLWEGTFRFKDSLGNYPIKDSFDITIEMEPKSDPDNTVNSDRFKFMDWGGVPDSVFYSGSGSSRLTYREVWTGFGFFYTWIRLYHQASGRVELEFAQTTFTNIRKPYFLIGRKLN